MPNIEHYNNIARPTTLESESGLFQLDERGFAYSFEPAASNLFVEETGSVNNNYIIETLASIRTLYLPKAWEKDAHLNRNGDLKASFISFEGEWGYLCWPSTKIGELKFY